MTREQSAVRPLRVALVDDYPIVVKGLASMLAPYADRVQVVELDTLLSPVRAIDVVLRDTFGMAERPHDLVAEVGDVPVVIFAFSTEPAAVRAALDAGAAGYVSKAVSEDAIVAALERVCAGETVVELGEEGAPQTPSAAAENWPGKDAGLSPKESEVLGLICQGLTNEDVAGAMFLSINTVKTYIRATYRKIGAGSRSQAVIWGLDHGLVPHPWRQQRAGST